MGDELEAVLGKKIILRLVLPATTFIFLDSIDRANVGFAALQMNADLAFSSTQFGFGAGVLFIGYVSAKLPSVMWLRRIGIRRWLAMITFFWGISASSMAFIHTAFVFYVLRFSVGIAAAGLVAGLMIYLSSWTTEKYRALILAVPIATVAVSLVVAAPLSGWLLEMANPLRWEGWRWMFLMEGTPALLLAAFALAYFPDAPDRAKWLTEDERHFLRSHARPPAGPNRDELGAGRWAALGDPVTWFCALIWFCLLAGNYGLSIWLPQIVHGLSGFGPTATGIIVALPWIGNATGLIFNAHHSDRHQERFLHMAVPAFVAAGALLVAYANGPSVIALAALTLAGTALGAAIAPFWA
ncbi:MAG TPA: MFS transporter, partial [Stellaceae bacterium]|nr:MFS transporter [Stellaceae bacterium]